MEKLTRVVVELAEEPCQTMCVHVYDDHILSINIELPDKLIVEVVSLEESEAIELVEDYLIDRGIDFHTVE